ncbi:MAG: hypothetical protein EOO38_11865 [Cytophagaceae bacterium]|nr:MAG: hypothetical protein EOO38_11865 [Cytophagaceae bacterium]
MHKVQSGPEAVTAREAFHMATRAGALALNLPDCGFLAPAMRADIVLLDLRAPHVWPEAGALISRLVYAAKSSDVRMVWVDGKLCVKNSKVTHASQSAILKAATQATTYVRQRMGLQVKA